MSLKQTRIKGEERPNSKTKSTVNGYGGFTLKPFGTQKFKNGEHKGYTLYSFGVKIGTCESLENRDNLEILVNPTEAQNTKFKLNWIGGVSINPDSMHLFSGFEKVIEGLETVKTLKGKLKAGRIRKARRLY